MPDKTNHWTIQENDYIVKGEQSTVPFVEIQDLQCVRLITSFENIDYNIVIDGHWSYVKMTRVKVDFNIKGMLDDMGLNPGGKVQTMLNNEILRISDPFAPFDVGTLKNSGKIEPGNVAFLIIHLTQEECGTEITSTSKERQLEAQGGSIEHGQ